MTKEQLDQFFEEACTTWLVEPKRVVKIHEAWDARFLHLDAQTFNFALRRAEERHTRYLPTIPQILEIYREVDRAATSREKSNRLLSDRSGEAVDRDLTASECHREAEFFTRRAAEIRAEGGGADRVAFARWFEQLGEFYAAQAPRVASGARMDPPPKLTDVLAAMGIERADRGRERERAAHRRKLEDAEAYAA